MTEFKEFPKKKVEANSNFYGWAFLFVMFIFMGLVAILEKKISLRNDYPPLEGGLAVSVGTIFVIYGCYSLYHLFFKAKTNEESFTEYHDLSDFEEKIGGFDTKFAIEHCQMPADRTSGIPVFYYQLEIKHKNNLFIGLNIRLRDRLEYFLWKIHLTRFNDILTNNYYFDSRYRVKSTDKVIFLQIFKKNVIKLLENFDRDYPPIRKNNGTLIITDQLIKYIEGPYGHQQKIFDPHRGTIENLFMELIEIIKEIEKNVPEVILNKNKLIKNNTSQLMQQNKSKTSTRMDMIGTAMMWLMTIIGIVYFIAKPFLR